MNKNLCLNDSERDWLLKVRSILSKPQPEVEEQPIPTPPNDEIWYTSSDGNIVRPASRIDTDMETGDAILIYGPYNDMFGGADIISNTYENGKGIIKFDGDVTKLEPSEDSIEHNDSMFYEPGIEDSRLTSINLPDSVTSIGDYAFSGCTGLTSINIPNSVTSIGDYAFSACTGLTSINIPNSVTSIGENAFSDVLNVYYNGTATGSPWGARCINGYIENDIVYTDNTKTQLIGISPLYSGSINIPNSVTSIGDSAFHMCTGLTSINLPNSVTGIGYLAFSYCTGLTSITIPDSVTCIGEQAFNYCTGLTTITISNSVTSIGDSTFFGCTGLTSINIPNSVTSIGDYAFSDCKGLTTITIPDSVTCIGERAFSGCTGLTSINIPDSVTCIGGGAFSSCSKLTSINLPNSVTSIEGGAFSDCKGLTTITIPNSVTSIGDYAFSDCKGLTTITIPNSVTSIGEGAFFGCKGLTSIISLNTTPPTLVGDAFDDTNDCPIYVPSGSVGTYQSAENWSTYSSRIQAISA